MRARLVHPFSDRRGARRRRERHLEQSPRKPAIAPSEPAAVPGSARAAETTPDLDLQRAREAGGPVDEASYSCGCGYVFAAQVSTTVACPVCGACQAW